MIRSVGQRQQFHIRLIGKAIAFARVTSFAGGNHIGPRIFTTARQGHDMIPAQFDIVKVIAAIQTHILISSKQRAIGKGRLLSLLPIHLALAGYDAVECDHGLLTGES